MKNLKDKSMLKSVELLGDSSAGVISSSVDIVSGSVSLISETTSFIGSVIGLTSASIKAGTNLLNEVIDDITEETPEAYKARVKRECIVELKAEAKAKPKQKRKPKAKAA